MPRKSKTSDGQLTGEYFGKEQEAAVVAYINATDQIERSRIYNKHLKKALDTMCESIIKRYKLHRNNMSLDEAQIDALNDLVLKADKFKPDKNKKAYSYYGTIIKRYLIGKRFEDNRNQHKYESFDDMYEKFEEQEDFQYEIDDTYKDIDDTITSLLNRLKSELNPPEGVHTLTQNEIKLGNTLIDIISQRKDIISNMGVGTKYNKIAILEILRTHSGLSTKDIRVAMKRFKSLYELAKID